MTTEGLFIMDGRAWNGIGTTRLKVLLMVLRTQAYPPTVRSMARELGLHINAIAGHLEALKRDGLITSEPHTARTWLPACEFIPA